MLVAIGSAFMPDRWKSPTGDIALVRIQGMLMDSQDIVRQLSDYRHNPGVRAILLRINSPGGAVAPAQEIYREVAQSGQSCVSTTRAACWRALSL